MEDFKAEEPKFYEGLPKERQRELRKEYYTSVNPRAKIWRLIGIFFLLTALPAGGFMLYCFVKSLFTDDFAKWMWLIASLFMPLSYISLTIRLWVNDGFSKWLWSKKDILSKDWPKKRKQNAETSESSRLKVFKELPKDKKRKIFKEYFSVNRAAKRSWWLGIVIFLLTLWEFGLILYYLAKSIYTYSLFFNIFMIAVCGFGFLFNYIGIKNQFWKWLEYEKKIIKKEPKIIDKKIV